MPDRSRGEAPLPPVSPIGTRHGPGPTAPPPFDAGIVRRAVVTAFAKLDPRHMVKSPVMFVVEAGSVFTTVLFLHSLGGHGDAPPVFAGSVALALWSTVLFANFAEAIAEGRGVAHADALRAALGGVDANEPSEPRRDAASDLAMLEGAERTKTANQIGLDVLLAALSIVFVLVAVTLLPYSAFAADASATPRDGPLGLTLLTALVVCLIPTTIGGLSRAIGAAGMGRVIQANVIAASPRLVEAACDVDVLLVAKTGTITLGNRRATRFVPAEGVDERELADAALFASLADETPEGRSIVALATAMGLRAPEASPLDARFVPFTAQTRMSGVDSAEHRIRKGAADAIARFVGEHGGVLGTDVGAAIEEIATRGGTPLVVADRRRPLGVVHLDDAVKGGTRERFAEMRRMGIRSVIVTGDNSLTAAAIAAEAGVDDFLAEATPEAKLATIREYQAKGYVVAMTGHGTNDAPALAGADVAVAMSTGTQGAREPGNMVDLDSSPTKLLSIAVIGKEMLMTRGSLATFSIASDVSKYFAIIPAAFVGTYPALGALNVMGLTSPTSAVLSAVLFNALVIVALIPTALRGVPYRPEPAPALLRRNLLVYGLGGLLLPFPCIKAIDLLLTAIGLV